MDVGTVRFSALGARHSALGFVGLVALGLGAGSPAWGQDRRDHGTIVIVIGAEPTLPVPALSSGKANVDVASLMFLPLARPGKKLVTTDEKGFEPLLAKSWTRRDSLTLVFDLDPRAKWHDGVPVTSRDVVWSLNRARDSTAPLPYPLLLRDLARVTAEGPLRVVVTFRRAYAEQMYDAVFHAPPLPAHLLDTIPPARLATSAFVSKPVGNGPYRWVKFEPGRQAELAANPDFFLGGPKLDRVIFLIARAGEAQLNLMLDGTADAYEAGLLPRQITPIVEKPSLRILTQPSLGIGYLLFNQRTPGDRSKPHPILADPEIRRAIGLGIDRRTLVRSVFGPYASLIEGPMGSASWVRRIAPPLPGPDPALARKILAERGWKDSDGDGVLERNGIPLSLRLSYPGTSLPRVSVAEPVQAMLRAIGVTIELNRLDGPVWADRRAKGEFDIDISQTTMDPTPSGLVQSWSCAGIGNGGTNVGSTCNPRFDEALNRAVRASGDAGAAWKTAIMALQADNPAVFLYSLAQVVVLHQRYRNVSVRADLPWSDLWRWSVDPSQRLARDQR